MKKNVVITCLIIVILLLIFNIIIVKKNKYSFWYNKDYSNILLTGEILDLNYSTFSDSIVVQTNEMGKVQVMPIPDLDLKVGQKVRFLIVPEILECYPPIVTPLYFVIVD